MNRRQMLGTMALALAVSACSNKAKEAVDAAMAPPQREEPAKQQADDPKSAAAPDAGAAAAPADFRLLAPFLPERLGKFEQRGEIDGELTTVVGMPVSQVSRRYEVGDKTLFVTITDAIAASEMREPFALALTFNTESARGYEKGKRIGKHPAVVMWNVGLKRSDLTMLVADRYVVKVDVREATSGDEAEKLALMLDIDGLAKLDPSGK